MLVTNNGSAYVERRHMWFRVDEDDTFTGIAALDGAYLFYGDSAAIELRDYNAYPVTNLEESVPSEFSLSAFPNPFNSTATLHFELPRETRTEIVLYDVLGREAVRLADDIFSAGTHQMSIEAGALASGVYFANLRTPDFSTTTKLLLLR
ncbi:MAG: T9SS type A sorting domain-containing protein [bacterium]|nr:T9SS type A sorting domain-containing protein [bacterium]